MIPKRALRLSLFLIALLFFLGQPGTVAAQNSDLVIEIQPGEASLLPGKEFSLHLAVHNSSEEAVYERVVLTWTEIEGLSINADRPQASTISPGGSLQWVLHLEQESAGVIADKVLLQLAFTRKASGDSPAASGVLFAEIPLSTPALGDPLALSIDTTIESLSEQRPGIIFLTAENTSSAGIQLERITPVGPHFLTLSVEDDGPWTIAPGNRVVIPVTVQALSQVQPGKHLLYFHAAYTFNYAGIEISKSASIHHEIDVGVFGENEILNTFAAVPSFLLLPGFLMIATFNLMWTLFMPPDQKENIPLKLTSEYFWVVSIFLSLLMSVVYPYLTSFLLGSSRNFLTAYGFLDFIYVWGFSLFLGAMAYLINSSYKQFRFQRRVPATTDTPAEILKKMDILGIAIKPYQVSLKQPNKPAEEAQTAFLLEPWEQAKSEYWVCPQAVIVWSEETYDQDVYDQIEDLISEDGSPGALADLLAPGKLGSSGIKRIDWVAGTMIQHPARVTLTLEQIGSPQEYFRFEME